jgi:hypothetical protein
VARLQPRDVALADEDAPAVGCSSPASRRSAVVLPQPDGPSMARKRPSGTVMSSGASASVDPKLLDTPS